MARSQTIVFIIRHCGNVNSASVSTVAGSLLTIQLTIKLVIFDCILPNELFNWTLPETQLELRGTNFGHLFVIRRGEMRNLQLTLQKSITFRDSRANSFPTSTVSSLLNEFSLINAALATQNYSRRPSTGNGFNYNSLKWVSLENGLPLGPK